MFQVVLRNESNQASQCFFRAFSALSYVVPQGRSKTLHKFKLLKQFFVTFNAEYEIIKNITM